MKLKLQSVGVRASECTCPPVNKRRGWLDCCEFLRPQMSLTWSWISFSSHFTNIIEISTTSWHDFLKRFEPFEFCPVLSQSIWKSHCSACWLWVQLVLPGSAGWSCVCRLLLFISQESVLNLTGSEPGQMCYQTNSQQEILRHHYNQSTQQSWVIPWLQSSSQLPSNQPQQQSDNKLVIHPAADINAVKPRHETAELGVDQREPEISNPTQQAARSVTFN